MITLRYVALTIKSSLKRFALFLLGGTFFLYKPALAASGTAGAAFLNIPVGAAPAALGSGYTALATDAYAPVWNPAGMGFLDSTQVAGQHLSYLQSLNYEFTSFVHPLRKGSSLGASFQYMTSGDITQTNTAGDTTGTFSTHYGAYSLAYGQALSSHLSLGVTTKFIEAKISDVSAHAYAFDLGSLYKVQENWRIAAVVGNLGTRLKFLNDSDALPLAFHLGTAYQPIHQLTLNLEGIAPQSGLASLHSGVEWSPLDVIALRAGYRTDTLKELSAIAGFSTGLGLNLWGQEFSYAWVPYGDLGDTQYFSLLVRFGSAEERKRNLIQYENIRRHRIVNETSTTNDPETQQLMQLLSQDKEPVAQASEEGLRKP